MELTVERVDSELGTWTSAYWSPRRDDPLYGVVERMFYWDGLAVRPRERVFPDGRISLIVQLDEPHRPGVGLQRDPFPPLCVEGLRLTPNVIEAPASRARVAGVALHPLGAVTVFGTPLDASGATHALDDVVGRAAGELGERVAGARGPRACIGEIIAWLRARTLCGPVPDPAVVALVSALEASGARSVGALMERMTASPSRLSGAFRSFVGIPPKRFANVLRFRRALELVCDGTLPLAEVAAASGYYDQSHFNAEFKAHAGMTPSKFLAGRRYPGSSSLSEGARDENSKTAAPAAV